MSDPCSRPWLERQVTEYTRLHPVYRRYGDALAEILGSAARTNAPLSIIQTRAKQIPSFAEKCLRKCSKYSMPSHQLTDLCGARLIARTASEVRAVSRFLEAHLDIDWENSDDVSDRLSWSEFGYRSIHYVVSLRRTDDLIPVDDDLYGFECSAPECPGFGTFHPLKAEIQVRTLAEHAWADFAHDITYKGAFRLPEQWLREIALMAADLEDVDRTVERIEEGLRTYAASYGAYLEPEQLIAEIETLETVLSFDPGNARLAWRIGKLAMTEGDWDRAVGVMDRFVDPDDPTTALQPLLRDLGVSLRKSGEVERGRRYLEAAVELDPTDSDAIASLAGTWRGDDEARAHALYRRAFEVDPTDYYPLLNYVDGEIERTGTTGILDILAPMASQAMARCRAHVDVGINIPWSLSSLAKFHLLLGDPYPALEWYSAATRAATSGFAVPSLERTRSAASLIAGHDWCDRLLVLARAARFGDGAARAELAGLATPGVAAISSPVLIVAGGTDPRRAEEIEGYRSLIATAVAGFGGTVISGGTRQGVCGMVGEAAASGAVRTIGYLPNRLPADADADERYGELRRTPGDGFSPLDPLQNWIDLISSGVDPAEVVVLGIGGGQIAATEYRIALALGARVGIVVGSGREASRLLADPRWNTSPGLISLPADPQTVRAFVASPAPALGLEPAARDALAREMHRAYREEIAATRAEDPAQRPWESLTDDLKQSNLDQADDIIAKVEAIGCAVRPIGAKPAGFSFTAEEAELLAEMEHGRWTADRLRSGWRWGPRRDPDSRISPYLVPWTQVPDEIRDYDREFVNRIPALLASVGLEIVREG